MCLSERAVVCCTTLWLALCCNCQDNQAFVAIYTHYRHILYRINCTTRNMHKQRFSNYMVLELLTNKCVCFNATGKFYCWTAFESSVQLWNPESAVQGLCCRWRRLTERRRILTKTIKFQISELESLHKETRWIGLGCNIKLNTVADSITSRLRQEIM